MKSTAARQGRRVVASFAGDPLHLVCSTCPEELIATDQVALMLLIGKLGAFGAAVGGRKILGR